MSRASGEGSQTMAASLLALEAEAQLPYQPVPEQRRLLSQLASFVTEGGARDVFVLNGYAGTGKTSLVGAFIKAMDARKMPVAVLAPTGRAAKVAASLSSHKASTIHRRIYRPDLSDPSGRSWVVAPNEARDTLFIVDEASLIPDRPGDPSSLLRLLARYVYSAPGCRMLLVGDEAQLPPVGQDISTALNPERLARFGLRPIYFTLDLPLRQAAGSAIIHNATLVRRALFNPDAVPDDFYLDVSTLPGMEAVSTLDLADRLSDSFAEVGEEETVIVTRSNWRANAFNQEVRNRVLYAEEPVQTGERLVIAKNDYYWLRNDRRMPLIANGDVARVSWVGRTEKMYGRFFTEVELELSDGRFVTAQLMLRSLMSEGPSIPREEMARFEERVMREYEGEFTEKIKGSQSDPYFNALQAKYAYCLTCHKAQGGQWRHVYVDMSGIAPEAMDATFYRWLYTALTRATEKVFLINPTVACR